MLAGIDLFFYRDFLESLSLFGAPSNGISSWHDGVTASQHLYSALLNIFFDGFVPAKIVLWTQGAGLGPLPDWWKEGLVMLYVIVGQWVQTIRDGKANARDAQEYLAVCVVVGVGAYVLGAAQSLNAAIFFGIAGTFGQLMARGSVSFIMGTATDAEAWTGRYVLRSLGMLLWAASLFLLAGPLGLPLLGRLLRWPD